MWVSNKTAIINSYTTLICKEKKRHNLYKSNICIKANCLNI